jgi:hypothetical protein
MPIERTAAQSDQSEVLGTSFMDRYTKRKGRTKANAMAISKSGATCIKLLLSIIFFHNEVEAAWGNTTTSTMLSGDDLFAQSNC